MRPRNLRGRLEGSEPIRSPSFKKFRPDGGPLGEAGSECEGTACPTNILWTKWADVFWRWSTIRKSIFENPLHGVREREFGLGNSIFRSLNFCLVHHLHQRGCSHEAAMLPKQRKERQAGTGS